MLFNPADKSKSIIADIDFLLWGNSAVFNDSYSLSDRTRSVNISLDEIIVELFKADPNFKWDDITNADFPIAYTDLSPGKDHYVIPDSTLVIHRLRVKDRNGHFKTLTPVMRSQLSDGELNNPGDPESYYKMDNAVFVVGVPDYGFEDGVEIEFQRGANHFSNGDTNKSPGFASQFHQFLSINSSLRYATATGMSEKITILSNMKEGVRRQIVEHYQTRSKDKRPNLSLKKGRISRFGLR